MTELPAVSPESRAMIERLIAFDTTSRNSNLDLIHDIRDYLAGFGIESELTFDADKQKANLYATLGPTDRGGIALSGHTDVVPVDGQDWNSDPFAVVERDGKLYGRGTCDMKSFIAVSLACVPRFLERELETPIHLCFSFDEEVGCVGVRHLLAALAARSVKPRACIIGEPTSMRVVNGHKGKISECGHVRGLECHSSLAPTGVNAIQAAAKVIEKIDALARDRAENGPFDSNYDVPHTTVHCGVIEGGTALNIVPRDCRFEFEVRNLPADDADALIAEIKAYAHEEVEPAMKAIDPDSGFSWEPISSFLGLATPEESEVVILAKALAAANDTTKVSFGTEAGLFSAEGMPAVVCGPGSIEQAHKPNEFVSLEQVALCERFMERLMERVWAG